MRGPSIRIDTRRRPARRSFPMGRVWVLGAGAALALWAITAGAPAPADQPPIAPTPEGVALSVAVAEPTPAPRPFSLAPPVHAAQITPTVQPTRVPVQPARAPAGHEALFAALRADMA